MQLCDLQPGSIATITQIKLQNPFLERRMQDIGVFENVKVELLAKAPFCGPIAICVKNQSVTIRHCDAACIEVDLQ